MHEQVLVVEDEADIRELIKYNLEEVGYAVAAFASAEEAGQYLALTIPDIVILDVMLPNADGFEFAKAVRSVPRTSHVPIIMLTARDDDADIIMGLESGADDYITKPFNFVVLTARVRAVLRRCADKHSEEDRQVVVRNGLIIDRKRFLVRANGASVSLTLSEFKILEFLMLHPGEVFARGEIVNAIRGADYPVTERAVDVQIVGLRRKLGIAGELVETVRGVGYRFAE